jgi:hypothetical protein
MKLFKRRETDVEFCDRCGQVCDARCRANAFRQRNFDQIVRNGWILR